MRLRNGVADPVMDRSSLAVSATTVKRERELFNLSPTFRSRCNWLDKVCCGSDSNGDVKASSKVVLSIRYSTPCNDSNVPAKDCSSHGNADADISTWNVMKQSERSGENFSLCRCRPDGTSSNSSSHLQGSCSDGGESNAVQRQLVYTFGLPADEFESLCLSCKKGDGGGRKQDDQRKRKQEQPVRRVSGRAEEVEEEEELVMGHGLQRKGKELMWSGEYNMQDKRTCHEFAGECFYVRDESEERNTWRSCMEKMKAFSLRSDSSTDTDENNNDDNENNENNETENRSESTLDSLSSQGKEEKKKRSRRQKTTPFNVERLQSRLFHANGFTADFRAKGSKLQMDHPSREPKDTLLYSLYQVFKKAGKGGLTAREAVSKIMEKELPGLDECGVAARAEARKMLRNSPYFMELGDKFVLCSAITGLEDKVVNGSAKGETGFKEKLQQQSWIAHAVRRARTGKSRRKTLGLDKSVSPEKQKGERGGGGGGGGGGGMEPRKRLKTVQQDSTGLGNRCNRSDGKGWHCPLFAQVGYSLCDHHLDRLRAKSGSRTRRPNRKRAEKQLVRNKHKPKVAENNNNNNGGGKVESSSAAWGIRESLSVARGSRRSNMFRSKRLQQQEKERQEQLKKNGEISGEGT